MELKLWHFCDPRIGLACSNWGLIFSQYSLCSSSVIKTGSILLKWSWQKENSSSTLRIWRRFLRISMSASCLTRAPTPSHGPVNIIYHYTRNKSEEKNISRVLLILPLPWPAADIDQEIGMLYLVSCWPISLKCLRFLYWVGAPSDQKLINLRVSSETKENQSYDTNPFLAQNLSQCT